MQASESTSDPRKLLSQWVDEHADALYRFALTRVGDKHAIEDLLQDTYPAAVKAYPIRTGAYATLLGRARLSKVTVKCTVAAAAVDGAATNT